MQSDQTVVKNKFASSGTTAEKAGNPFIKQVKDRTITLVLAAALIAGICLLAYPSFSDYWNAFHQTRAVMSYAESVANMNEADYARLLDEAKAYNARLAEQGISWVMSDEARAEYTNTLDVSGDGVMGYIQIRKINVLLPVYHGTEERILQTSIGHLEQTSLPVGGEGSHCMLSGHRGLPSARLFTDLDQMREGDTFTLTVLNETLTYEVEHIWIVDPTDYSHLAIEEGRDLCTLITCTPYGVNTQRLLIQGRRIENANGDAMVTADAIQIRPVFIAPFIAVPILLFLLIYVLVSTGVRRRNRRSVKAEYLGENGLTEPELDIENRDVFAEAIKTFIKRDK